MFFKLEKKSIQSVVCCFVWLCLIGYGDPSWAQEFDKEQARAELLSIYESVQATPLKIVNYGEASPKHQEAIDYFRDVLWEDWNRISELSGKIQPLYILLDRGLYRDDAEKKEWQDKIEDFSVKYAELANSSQYKEKVETLARLTEGLPGEFSQGIRLMGLMQAQGSFPESMNTEVNRMMQLSQLIDSNANDSEFNDNVTKGVQRGLEIRKLLREKKITFDEARKQFSEASAEGSIAFVDDFVKRSREALDEKAILQTQLAQSKGFDNWAEYSLAMQAHSYEQGFATVEGRIQFLEQILVQTESEYKEAVHQRLNDFGLSENTPLDWIQYILLQPSNDVDVEPYFPKENLEEILTRTMIESGFSGDLLSEITYDSWPRDGKSTHAYMTTIEKNFTEALVIDAKALDPRFVERADNRETDKIFIVQNFRSDGLSPLKTIFHETGHALDFMFSPPTFTSSRNASYNETMAMTLEAYLKDREFLKAYGQDRDGNKITQEIIDQYLEESKIGKLFSFRNQVALALFDLKLWSHKFESGSMSFVQRAKSLYVDIIENALLLKLNSDNDRSRSPFITSHFYGGSVNYIGYIEAAISADLTRKHLLDTVEEQTGRRTLYKQPGLAKVLVDQYYKVGYKLPFPTSIETITGQSVSAKSFSENLAKVPAVTKATQNKKSAVRCRSVFQL